MDKMIINKLINSKRYYHCLGLYVVFTLIVAIIGFGKLPGGKQIFTNKKASMLPLISNNSLTVTQPFAYYNVGDIISYYQQVEGREVIVTHRIAQMGGNVYITKGDYNEAVDSEVVRPRLVIGKVILIVPWFGLIFSLVKSPWGTGLFILLPAAVIILLEIYRIKTMLSQNK